MISLCIWQPFQFSKDEHKFNQTKLKPNAHQPRDTLIGAINGFGRAAQQQSLRRGQGTHASHPAAHLSNDSGRDAFVLMLSERTEVLS